MTLIRPVLAALLLLPLAAACGSDAQSDPPCAACAKEYTSCSFPNLQESMSFHIETRDSNGCTGVVQGAPMHLKCEPLRICWDNLGTCESAKFTDQHLFISGGGVCG